MSASAVVIIPARLHSQRLPEKMILNETGKYLIQHVYEQVKRARNVERVLVATDDARIAEAVRSFRGEVVMTRPDHESGTSRVAEAAGSVPNELIINVQGDEPEIDPAVIDAVAEELAAGHDFVTAATMFRNPGDIANPSKVKVGLDDNGFALYFTRTLTRSNGHPVYLHLGLYGYRKPFLKKFVSLPPGTLEKQERLEQLRALENGCPVRVIVRSVISHGGIDTIEDYTQFVNRYRNGKTR